MKSRFLVFGLVIAAIVFLYKRLLDTQEQLVIAEAERNKLQREQDAIKESFTEANARYEEYNAENPIPIEHQMEIAMKNAIFNADAHEELEDEEDDS